MLKDITKDMGTMRSSRLTLSVVLSVAICVSLVAGQGEIVPVRDITGGANVFVFPNSTRSQTRRFVTQTAVRRTSQQRAATARRVSRQYSTLARTAPRRTRVAAVDPDQIKPEPPDKASRTFAGVGEYYMDRNDYEQAITFFRESYTLDSTNQVAKNGLSEALALRGNELLALNADQLAQKDLEEAIELNPRNAPALFGLAEIYSETGRYEDAIANYERALEYDNELTEILVPLGTLYYQRAIANADSPDLDRIKKAESLLSRAVATINDDAQAQHYLGLSKLALGETKAAQSAFATAMRVDPTLAEAFYYHGETQMRLGNTSAAISDFRKAAELNSNYFQAWFGLGSANFELAAAERNEAQARILYEEAVKALEEAKRLRNDNAEVVANLGDAYRQLGRYNEAVSNYHLATVFIKADPGFAGSQTQKDLAADILIRLAYSVAKQCEINMERAVVCDWKRAIDSLEEANRLSENNLVFANLGWAYHNAGRTDIYAKRTEQGNANLEKARENLKKAMEASSDYDQGVLMNLGAVYSDLGDHKAAVDMLRQVAKSRPNWAFAANELGKAYANSGDLKQALSEFRRATKLEDGFAEAHFNLGYAEFRSGNTSEAQKAYNKLRSLNRTDLADRLRILTGGAVRG
ncbi:MAG TPA: tetratricopeptide repeat protein [Pyrinomonadaceae bacterium]|nr:tetratricopeptide repeat protein [Pyrinomonadaceae bacterium]HMP65197.1 tetratricopeptide repeat protein [Pyrinomonadaceae bacterium]